MKRNKLIMAPGPTNVPEHLMQIVGAEFPHHRTNAFAELLANLQRKMKEVIRLDNGEVITFTSSGTGSMEATVANFFSHGDKVLVINTGFFGERYAEIARRFGLEVLELTYELGETYKLVDVEQCVAEHPDLRAIFVTHHETSTGVLNDIAAIGAITQQHADMLCIVDSISGLLVHPFEMTKWHIDAVAFGSQKGFLLPPGLSFSALSEKALLRIETATLPRFYWDYRMMIAMSKKGQTPSTPAINLMQALDHSLDEILAQGLERVWEHHLELRQYLEAKLVAMGLTLGVQDESIKGNVCVPVFMPEGIDSEDVRSLLEDTFDIITVIGLGKYARQSLRVGVIGPLTEVDVDQFIAGLTAAIAILKGEK